MRKPPGALPAQVVYTSGVGSSILATKLRIPALGRGHMERPVLTARMMDGMARRVTLVSAPAGYGKTSAVAEWLEKARTVPNPPTVAWLSLDSDDGDSHRFLLYCVSAIASVSPSNLRVGTEAAEMCHSAQRQPASDIVISLINDVARSDLELYLILDDYHETASPEVDAVLAMLIDQVPDRMHVVIVSRMDPGVPLARLRARGELTEIRAAELRFSTEEASSLLSGSLGVGLTAAEVKALEHTTEGWVAGLQLAGMALQAEGDSTATLREITGTHRHIMDYLVEEVLARQTDEVRAFLSRTAYLKRLSGPLCNAVTGQTDSQSILESLDRQNLFIMPLDGERFWYRYHHLFAGLLRARVGLDADSLQRLHRSAAEWYVGEGLTDQAIDHALQCGDMDWAASLIAGIADEVWRMGDAERVRGWLKDVPADALRPYPLLTALQAYSLNATGNAEVAAAHLEHAARTADDESVARPGVPGRVAAIASLVASVSGDVPSMMRHAARALELLPRSDSVWRASAAVALGDAWAYGGDMHAALAAQSEAVDACRRTGNRYMTLVASVKLIATLRELARTDEALSLFDEQLGLASEFGYQDSIMIGILKCQKGEILIERNSLEKATQLIDEGCLTVDGTDNRSLLCWALLSRVKLLHALAEHEELDQTIEQIIQVSAGSPALGWVGDQAQSWRCRLWLDRGDTRLASAWLEEHDPENQTTPQQVGFFAFSDLVMAARVLAASGAPDRAASLLDRLAPVARQRGRMVSLIEILCMQALAQAELGDDERADAAITEALALAEPQHLVRPFVSEGTGMARCLHGFSVRNGTAPFIARILGAFPAIDRDEAEREDTQSANSELMEPLSDRELDVLRCIARGLSNEEIGEHLYISVHTVKTHARNINYKLGSHSRTQAVSKARGIGLLQSD